jgi:hypothetical protein
MDMSEARRGSGFGTRDSGLGNTASNRATPIDLDLAIDAVAREMTDVESPGDLRARVFERIEQERRRPVFALPEWAWAGAAASLLLAILTAIWFARPVQVPGGSDATVAEQRVTSPPVPPAAQPQRPVETPDSSVARPVLAPRGTHPGPLRTVEAGASEMAEETSLVSALAEIQPLKFSTVEPGPLQIADVEVAAFPTMPEIDMPSLNPGTNESPSVDPKKEREP